MPEDMLASETYWKETESIPGSTRVPIEELADIVKKNDNCTILDLGSGEGRSTRELKDAYPKAKIIAFDLNRSGLKKTDGEFLGRIQGTALELPFADESANGVVLCGVMTNITDKDPKKAILSRKKAIGEVYRVLKNGGVCVLSDFNQEHTLSDYPVNYTRHQLITGEYGTIAVFDPKVNISFTGKSDTEVSLLAKSPYFQRMAHHYSARELTDLIESQEGFRVEKYSAEVGITPSGKKIDTLVLKIRKTS